jgi:hypothetical protein
VSKTACRRGEQDGLPSAGRHPICWGVDTDQGDTA